MATVSIHTFSFLNKTNSHDNRNHKHYRINNFLIPTLHYIILTKANSVMLCNSYCIMHGIYNTISFRYQDIGYRLKIKINLLRQS